MRGTRIAVSGIVVLTTCVAMPIYAKPLTRRDTIRRAASENAKVLASRSDQAEAKALKQQARWARWPMLRVDLGVGPSVEADLVPGTAVQSVQRWGDLGVGDLSVAFGSEVTLIQPLYTFGKLSYRRDAADHGLRARQAQTRMTQEEVALEAARLYEAALLARDATRFFEEVEHILRRSIQATSERLAGPAPDVSEQDLIRLEAALSIATTGLNQARAGENQARAGLRAFLAIKDEESVELSETTLTLVASDASAFAALVAIARKRRPELAALSEGADAYRDLASAERAGYLPDLFIMGSVSAIYTPGRDDLDTIYVQDPLNRVTPSIVVGARWQLQGGSSGAVADMRQAQAAKLRGLRAWAQDAIPAEVRKAYEDGARARKDIDAASKGRQRSKQWMVQASADYAVGLASSRDVEESVEAYVTLRLAELDAVFRFNVAMAELAKATGTLVDGNSTIYK